MGISMFTYGQAQKWINMTNKYLYVFSLIFEDWKDERLCHIPILIKKHHEKLHIPIDNYILEELKLSKYAPWSKMDENSYNDCRREFENRDIDWELENWNIASDTHKVKDKTSYARYKDGRDKE